MAKVFLVAGDHGEALDARFEVAGNDIVLHSRGGTKGKDGKNVDYTKALLLIIKRLAEASIPIKAAWVDSSSVQELPFASRQVLHSSEAAEAPERIASLMGSRMKDVRIDASSVARGGNSTKRLRIATAATSGELVGLLRGVPVDSDKFPAEILHRVTPEHVFEAIDRLLNGMDIHPFGPSTDYDLITDGGNRLPPKAVFGHALSIALNGRTVLPKNFSSGDPCFRLLREAGYQIVPKDEAPQAIDDEDDFIFDEGRKEGQKRLAVHLRRERARGLSKAKKAQFRRQYGRLVCQRCGVDPVAEHCTDHAEVCIEVHHAAVQVNEMPEGYRTSLADLACLCANCHRLVHRLLRAGQPDARTWKHPFSVAPLK